MTTTQTTTEAPRATALREVIETRGHTVLHAGVEFADGQPGWRVVLATRESAYSVARWCLSEFEGDPEAGNPTVQVDGPTATRSGTDAWTVRLRVEGRRIA